MKIIAQGILPPDREWRAACVNCKTRFELLEREGVVEHDQREGTYIRCACPACGHVCFGSRK